jgi:hypothetical protein
MLRRALLRAHRLLLLVVRLPPGVALLFNA